MDKNAPIGIFDSGVGGLTVAREVMRQLPDERIVYFGDTARLPYGTKSQDTVIRFSEQIMALFAVQGSEGHRHRLQYGVLLCSGRPETV